MLTRKPALRHYAVLERVTRRASYSFWKVSDRRNETLFGNLLVPTRLIAWPILYSRTIYLNPRPVRLRDNKVALLFTNVETEVIVSSLKRVRAKYLFEATTGFSQIAVTKSRSRKLIPVIFAVFAVLLSLTLVSPSAPNEVSKPVENTCSQIPYLMELTKKEVDARSFSKDGVKFRISLTPKLGGLYQARIRRLCDKKLFQAKAWLSKDGLVITKLN